MSFSGTQCPECSIHQIALWCKEGTAMCDECLCQNVTGLDASSYRLLIAPTKADSKWEQPDDVSISEVVRETEKLMNPSTASLCSKVNFATDKFVGAVIEALESLASEPTARQLNRQREELNRIAVELDSSSTQLKDLEALLSGSTPGDQYVEVRRRCIPLKKQIAALTEKKQVMEEALGHPQTTVFHLDLVRLRKLFEERRRRGDRAVQPLVVYTNWEIFPAGVGILTNILMDRSQVAIRAGKNFDSERNLKISDLKAPEKIILGKQKFSRYIGLAYESADTVVFESMEYGNATYVINFSEWEEQTKLSKQEVRFLDGAERVIHNNDWYKNLKKVFKQRFAN